MQLLLKLLSPFLMACKSLNVFTNKFFLIYSKVNYLFHERKLQCSKEFKEYLQRTRVITEDPLE